MGITIRTPTHSFIRFNETGTFVHPIHGTVKFCLPVYDENDIAFQFVLEADTAPEALALLDLDNDLVVLGITDASGNPFTLQFSEKPERFKISDRQILYNWRHGLPAFDTEVAIHECFVIKIEAQMYGITYAFYSNCLERIDDADYTSVLEYGNDENAFGFNYCAADPVDPDSAVDCDPTVITFSNASTLTIPYTAQLQAMYGTTPSVQVWIYDGSGDLVNSGITATMDNVPPTILSFDFGGTASGVIRIS